jgi:hypothetical protein
MCEEHAKNKNKTHVWWNWFSRTKKYPWNVKKKADAWKTKRWTLIVGIFKITKYIVFSAPVVLLLFTLV